MRKQIKTWVILQVSSTPEPTQILVLHQGIRPFSPNSLSLLSILRR